MSIEKGQDISEVGIDSELCFCEREKKKKREVIRLLNY